MQKFGIFDVIDKIAPTQNLLKSLLGGVKEQNQPQNENKNSNSNSNKNSNSNSKNNWFEQKNGAFCTANLW